MGSKRQHIDIDDGVELQEMFFTVELTHQQAVARTLEQPDNWTTPLQRPADVVSRDRILFETRSAEVLAHRLRFRKCRLNSCLHKIALHDTGTCDSSCGQAETIEHYLINCSQNEIAAAFKNICDQLKISFTLPSILRQVAVLEEIRRLTHRQL